MRQSFLFRLNGQKKRLLAPLYVGLLLSLTACQRQNSVCADGSVTFIADPALLPASSNSTEAGSIPTPALVEIGGRMREVDRVIQGPLCSDTWRGTVYVACDVQVMEWVDTPTFFEECTLTVEPGTTVYVAAHNDAAYYKGCSCHTGQLRNE